LRRGRPTKGTVETMVLKHGFRIEGRELAEKTKRGKARARQELWIEDLESGRRKRIKLPQQAGELSKFISVALSHRRDTTKNPEQVLQALLSGTRWARHVRLVDD